MTYWREGDDKEDSYRDEIAEFHPEGREGGNCYSDMKLMLLLYSFGVFLGNGMEHF